MTKEDILDRYMKSAWELDESAEVITYNAAEKAMEEFGKFQAIEFIKWGISSGNITSLYHGPAIIQPDTEEELYTQFIEQQQK